MVRKIASLILALAICLGVLPGSTVAALEKDQYHEYALELYSVGLFKGTEIGFELERIPTRLEGAVMFVRLLGAEKEALNENYTHPFLDVPPWGDPYVGYLYHNELTNGISTNEFGSYLDLRPIEYMTFGLRALGYSDKGNNADFSWDSSIAYAYDNEIVSDNLHEELVSLEFTRGHVAWVSYELLLAYPRYDTVSLLDSLVADGSLSGNNAGAAFDAYSNGSRYIPKIGTSWHGVLAQNGDATEEFLSRYGFEWNVFGMDYENFIQVGRQNDSVKAVLGASDGQGYEKGIKVGMTKADVIASYGNTGITEIRKPLPGENSAIIYLLNTENKATYIADDGNYITYYYDSGDDNRITAFIAVDKDVEEETHCSYSPDSSIMEPNLERQIYHLTNAFRVQRGLNPLVLSISTSNAARSHSKDMVFNNYFSHENLQGEGPGDRVSKFDIPYKSLGENLAYGYVNPVDMINGWLNSQKGHRKILLGDYLYIGVGSALKDNKTHYCTQEYWR